MSDLLGLFTRASKLLRSGVDAAMSEHGVRVGQNLLLEALFEHDGLTPGEIAGRLHLSTPTVVNTGARMEAAGLVTKHRDAADARLVRLHLTDRARAIRPAVQEARRCLLEEAIADLTPDERRNLERALAKIIHTLETAIPAEPDTRD
jgi:MarR family transcriptional regulator, organic hydroperoxide resistance regulator